ncbi:hypothetical protein like AT3G57980 [Hibiscus trionum]|uniref:Bromo domain-containing protein n=1 Tax=Hibiscus trionum TaxID=183268 RepID=A0A9W7IL07_HIBTR|nr:hypothetical protein like AT3G57980 [Hibiscus trionum]
MAREDEPTERPWGTLEELLLVSAVNRHGTKSWDSIALELQSRKLSLFSFTPQLCKDKFSDLKRRFVSLTGADSSSGLVDQLRRIRVEELRREVQQRDVSIVSLELKVKRLVEERERTFKEETDLNDRQNIISPATVAGTTAGGDGSGDLDDRSFNESNSTSQKPELTTSATIIVKDEQNDAGEVVGERKAQVITEPVEPRGEDEADPVRTEKGPVNERLNVEEHDSKKQVSDVQSSASLSKKKWCSDSSKGGCSSREEREGDEVSTVKKRGSAVKPDSMVRLLGIIRSHRLGSALDHRQLSQESGRYRNLIRQHMDLQRIESRLDKGVYSGCSTKFFRDLLLLFNNTIVFHQKSSPESTAAEQLRGLVLKEMNHKLPKQAPPQSETDHLSKPKKSSTIVACGKRTSSGAVIKNATSKGGDKGERVVEEKPKANEKKVDASSFAATNNDVGIRKKRSKERAVSGRRNALRTSSKNGETNHEGGGNELSSHATVELKVDTKKENNKARKKQGAASFLKRMKQNSPQKEDGDGDDDAEDDGDGNDDSQDKSKDGKEKGRVAERVTRSSGGRGGRGKRGGGRLSKRAAAESRGKRGRENVDNEVGLGGNGRARKRGRR